jgi:hypothetical protein
MNRLPVFIRRAELKINELLANKAGRGISHYGLHEQLLILDARCVATIVREGPKLSDRRLAFFTRSRTTNLATYRNYLFHSGLLHGVMMRQASF